MTLTLNQSNRRKLMAPIVEARYWFSKRAFLRLIILTWDNYETCVGLGSDQQ